MKPAFVSRMVIRVVEFSIGGKKKRFLPQNQHRKRKHWNLRIDVVERCQKGLKFDFQSQVSLSEIIQFFTPCLKTWQPVSPQRRLAKAGIVQLNNSIQISFFTQFWIRTVIYDVRNKVINVLELVLMSHPLYLHLINKRHGSQTLQQIIWPWNHTSHKIFYFYEFVANVLRDNIW